MKKFLALKVALPVFNFCFRLLSPLAHFALRAEDERIAEKNGGTGLELLQKRTAEAVDMICTRYNLNPQHKKASVDIIMEKIVLKEQREWIQKNEKSSATEA